jgi:hypothetical protein
MCGWRDSFYGETCASHYVSIFGDFPASHSELPRVEWRYYSQAKLAGVVPSLNGPKKSGGGLFRRTETGADSGGSRVNAYRNSEPHVER